MTKIYNDIYIYIYIYIYILQRWYQNKKYYMDFLYIKKQTKKYRETLTL